MKRYTITFNKPTVVATIAAFGLLFSLLLVTLIYADGNNKITVCVSAGGSMRILGSQPPLNKCRRGETELSWNIQGPIGPKGDTGEKGEIGEGGEKGDQGEQGSSSNQLHVYDEGGQDLGLWTGGNGKAEYLTTYNQELGLFLHFVNDTSKGSVAEANFIPQIAHILFEGLDCQGPVFSINNNDLQSLLIANDYTSLLIHKYWKYDTTVEPQTRTARSSVATRSAPDGSIEAFCINSPRPDLNIFQNTLLVREVPIDRLPFTEPLAWPLEVRIPQ